MYWLDSNIFIEAKNTYYKFGRVPKFWAFLTNQLMNREVCCCREVYNELLKQKDDLANWVKTRKSSGMCVQPEGGVFKMYTEICDHVIRTYKITWAQEFCSGADGWVIAYARHFGGTVVTQEAKFRKRKVRIPVICKAFDVDCIDTFAMLERMGDPKF